jgi:glutathione synthase/RimK-type ligase-like ATP-grasp enzyme
MRKDPPFDPEYFYATHLLSQAEREGAKVFNKPAALRDHPEKLAILEFPQFIGPTLVTREPPTCAPSTPSTATSSSSRWTAWAAWASSASGPTA